MYKFFLAILFIAVTANRLFAQTTTFNFQGRLNDGGNPENSNYDFQFKFFNAFSGGIQVGFIVNRPARRIPFRSLSLSTVRRSIFI